MNKSKVASILGVSALLAGQIIAEEADIVISANRFSTPVTEVGSSIEVISKDELDTSKVREVSEILRQVPGININRNGGPGQNAGLFLRGAPNGFTRVMIDGVKINDPSGIGTAFNFAHLSPEGIERIEVLKGPQSTLYGSDAIGGVINIITSNGSEEPERSIALEGGSFDTFKASASASGAHGKVYYNFTASHLTTDGGVSATTNDTEDDGYENTTLQGRIGAEVVENIDVSVFVRNTEADTEYDAFDATFNPSEEGEAKYDAVFARAEANIKGNNNNWDAKLGYTQTWQENNFVGVTGVKDTEIEGETEAVDLQGNYFYNNHTITAGADWQEDEANTNPEGDDEGYDNLGLFLQDHLKLDNGLNLTLGGRVDEHSEFGSEFTYRGVAQYTIPDCNTTLKGSYGTGFKAPSLFELFAASPFVNGNPDLDPQTSKGWEVGVEHNFVDQGIKAGVTYFDIDYEDLITFVPGATEFAPGSYANTSKANSKGVEVSLDAQPTANLVLGVDYVWQDNEDESGAGNFELRKPENQVLAQIGYKAAEDLHFTLYGQWIDERDDIFGAKLDSYTLVHLNASYDVSEDLELYLRLENLLDEDYEELAGFGTQGFGAYAGVKKTF